MFSIHVESHVECTYMCTYCTSTIMHPSYTHLESDNFTACGTYVRLVKSANVVACFKTLRSPSSILNFMHHITHCTDWRFVCFQFVCQFCCQIFKRKASLINHLRAAHKIGKAFRCKFCGKDDFTSARSLYRHQSKCCQSSLGSADASVS